MKILSININQGCTTGRRRSAFHTWIQAEEPDLILCQESCYWNGKDYGDSKPITGFSPLKLKDGNGTRCDSYSRVACYAREGSPYGEIIVERRFACQLKDRWQAFEVEGISVHNLYLPDNSKKQRLEFLETVRKAISPHKPTLIAGDFNGVPTREDSQLQGEKSEYSNPDTWKAFKMFCELGCFYDATMPVDGSVYTIKRSGSRFRCDLAFASDELRRVRSVKARYEHGTRPRFDQKEKSRAEMVQPFTDHSGIVLEIDPPELLERRAGLVR